MESAVDMGEKAQVLPTHTPALFEEAVGRAVELLKAGQVVALPTETVYGLAANALDPDAVARIYAVKGRPSANPLIVHVVGEPMLRACVAEWPAAANALAKEYWPGPLTLVAKRSAAIPDVVTAGGDTVGVRWPGHPLFQAVARRCGFPLAAPSANPSNELSPTNAEHVLARLGTKIPLIIDGGQSQVGIESTVVDTTGADLRLLRPGMVSREELLATLARAGVAANLLIGSSRACEAPRPGDPALRSPGMLERHYSPMAPLVVMDWSNEDELEAKIRSLGWDPGAGAILTHSRVPQGSVFEHVLVIPEDPEAYARALYDELHRCDVRGVKWIAVETVPSAAAWDGIRDRLRRASAKKASG